MNYVLIDRLKEIINREDYPPEFLNKIQREKINIKFYEEATNPEATINS